MKGLAAALTIFSCGALGLILANSYTERVRNLRELIRFFQLLESEIQYARTTLPKLLAAQAPLFSPVVRSFLSSLHQGLSGGTGESPASIWERATGILERNGLPREVLEELVALGTVLGQSDALEQSKLLRQLLLKLEQAAIMAEEERAKQVRLWQYLGFSAGLLLVLLLI